MFTSIRVIMIMVRKVLNRAVIGLVSGLCFVLVASYFHNSVNNSGRSTYPSQAQGTDPALTAPAPTKQPGRIDHPINDLIAESRQSFMEMLQRRVYTLQDAAECYRERRGRHPPPGFGDWFVAASDYDAVIVEQFFDRIYDDLAPFWALDPRTIRERIHGAPFMIRVRNGKVKMDTHDARTSYRIKQWAKVMAEIVFKLPDIDMAVNHLDESRIFVP